ncbi:MAG TPA: PstS family phosphate ABC transporter substrate-binding protein [Actinomycetota bacterium]|nr:PstS family phosphate ABC transporter substrate-binding protein [Actinomycetota bacterium]
MAKRRIWPLVAVTTALAIVAAACSNDDDGGDGGTTGGGGNGGTELSGTILIDGSSTVAPFSEAAAELFQGEHPDVQVSVGTSGSGGGFEKFCNGETDISDASRRIEQDEIDACTANGIQFEEITVANDALSVLVNPENPVDCLTVEQLNQIWAPESTLSSWNQIDGLEVDFDEPLDLYGPGSTSGTFDYFTDAVNGEEGAIRTDYNDIGEDDNQGIVGIEGTLGGMFFVGYTYYVENQDRVKALAIDGGNGCVGPSAEAVQDGSYTPLGRGLYIYPKAEALQRPEVQAFVRFYIEENESITSPIGGIPLTDEQKAEAQAKVDSLLGG